MPGTMACPHCGSWAIRADRSLAGRLVCGRCGEPLGLRAARSARQHRLHHRLGGFEGLAPGAWPRWLLLSALVSLAAGLAVLEEKRSPAPSPMPPPIQMPSERSHDPEAAPAAATTAIHPSGRRA